MDHLQMIQILSLIQNLLLTVWSSHNCNCKKQLLDKYLLSQDIAQEENERFQQSITVLCKHLAGLITL